MSIALEKLMNLEDGQVLYNDLRERIENLPTGSNIVIPVFTLDETSQTPSTWTCDMTWAELASAINNGDCMACKYVYRNPYGIESYYFALVGITGEDSDCIEFESVLTYGTETRSRNIKFYDDETVTYTYNSSDLSDKADKADTVLDTTLSRGRKANTTVGTGSFAFGNNVEASSAYSHAEGGGTSASGDYAHAEGQGTTASNTNAHAEGASTTASGQNSHAEGASTNAIGHQSHAEGVGASNKSYYYYEYVDGQTVQRSIEKVKTGAEGFSSHSEGSMTTADGYGSHAEGVGTIAHSDNSHAEGSSTVATGYAAHAEGAGTTASGLNSHAEGRSTVASNENAHAEGSGAIASATNSHAEGQGATASYNAAHAEGQQTIASGQASHAEGYYTNADGNYSHAEGSSFHGNSDYKPYSYDVSTDTTSFTTINAKPGAIGTSSHSEGSYTRASSNDAHAEGGYTYASGSQAHAEGYYTNATGDHAHSEGYYTTASRSNSHAEGNLTIASGLDSHAEGSSTVAYGNYSHAEGSTTRALANYSHAEGDHSKARGLNSHTEGDHTETNATSSHAEGSLSTAYGNFSHAEGLYGRVNSNGSGAHSEGYGSSTNINYPQYNAPVDRTANFNGRTQPGTSINLPTGAHFQGAHNEGTYTTANANSSHAEGNSTLVASENSHAEGLGSIVTGGPASHAEGKYTYVSGAGGAHAEGQYTMAQGGGGEHAEGMYTIATGGGGTHAEGFATYVSGSQGAHAEGYYTYGTGAYGFHIEGDHTECAVLNGAHTEGYYSKSFGRNGAHTEGDHTIGRGEGSHTGGRYNVPNSCSNLPDWEPNKLYHVGDKVKYLYPGRESPDAYTCKTEHTSGSEFNSINWTYENSDNGYAEIIGNGTADDARANARALDWEGNEHLAGNLYVGCNPDSTGGTKVLTENDLEYTTEADALKIISDFWDEEEDEGMLVTANYMYDSANQSYYYETIETAEEIKAAYKAGKNVIVRFVSNDLAKQNLFMSDVYLTMLGFSDADTENNGIDSYVFGINATEAASNTNGNVSGWSHIMQNHVDANTGKLIFDVYVD